MTPFSLEGALVAASHVYRAGVGLRLGLYRSGIFKQKKLPCPVISIGNITAGGSGKTPMSVYIAERLLSLGRKPVVISRGYKGSLEHGAAVVGDGKKVFLDGMSAGDEPFMMAKLKRFPVVIGKDRYEAGMLALKKLDVDTIVLDDGFQHLGLDRNLDIVLMDYERPLGNGRMLPAGRLRETPEMCKERVGCIVMTRCPDLTDTCNDRLKGSPVNSFWGRPCFISRHIPYLAAWYGRDISELSLLEGRKVFLFSGIAWNKSFYHSVESMGVKVLEHLEFEDHYRYKMADLRIIREKALTSGADLILTTHKDWVKVDEVFDFQLDIGVMDIRIEFSDPDRLDRFLLTKILETI